MHIVKVSTAPGNTYANNTRREEMAYRVWTAFTQTFVGSDEQKLLMVGAVNNAG